MARNILVVEDDRNISDLIRMYLEKEGFEVRSAYDGGKAIEEYDKQAPDMVLLDIMLPVVDGWGVCAHIREKGKTPIIMLTAKSDVGDRITGLEMGADDYLVKPFEMKELMARINAVLRRSEIPDDTKKKLVFDKLVINLDSKGIAFDAPETEPERISYSYVESLYKKAQAEHPVSAEMLDLIGRLDLFVIEKFRVAFGNRIMKQLKLFVPVYVACGGTELGGMDYIIARKVLKKFESMNVNFVRDEITGLIEYIEKLFGAAGMPDSVDYLRRIQNLY